LVIYQESFQLSSTLPFTYALTYMAEPIEVPSWSPDQSTWGMCWVKWHWYRLSSEYFGFLPFVSLYQHSNHLIYITDDVKNLSS